MPIIISSISTPSFDNVTATPRMSVNTVVDLSDAGSAIYVKALSELSQYAYVLIDVAGNAQMATTTLAASSRRGGWVQQSIPSGYYGWAQISGAPMGNLAANCAPNVPLYTTATAGVLDDATVSGGLILGTIATVTISNATAVTFLVARGQMIGNGAMPGA